MRAGYCATKTIAKIQKNNLTTHKFVCTEGQDPKRRKIEQHIPSNELLSRKITNIYNVGGFLRIFRFPLPIKRTVTI